MSEFLEYYIVELECPKCGSATPKNIAWVHTHGHYACAGCGETVSVASEDLTRRIGRLEEIARRMGL